MRKSNILLIILSLLILTGCNDSSKSEEEIVKNNGYASIIKQNTFDGTLKSDIYDKSMDYNAFLEFDGIIQTNDFDNDGNEDYLIKSPLANTSESVYYIQFYGSERVLFLGAYEWGYLLSVECVDIDNNGSKELLVMGTNDHTYSVEDTSTFEIYEQNIWDNEIKWDKVRVPKGSRLMLQGVLCSGWNRHCGYGKSEGF